MKKTELRKVIDNNLIPHLPESKKAALWEIPYYTNLGDVLIWQGEESFLADNNIEVVSRKSFHASADVASQEVDSDTTIFLQGGGNFGDLWDEPMEFRRKVISKFTDNPITLFPQTVFYQNQELAEKDARLFAQHKNLILCARDRFSYDFLKKYFSANTILMVPDMAFCIPDNLLASNVEETSKNLFGARIDKELHPDIDYKKYLPESYETTDWPSFERPPKEYTKLLHMIQKGDEAADDYAVKEFMPAMVNAGVDFISQYSGIFSTRLHIAILSILLGKKVTWFDNSYGKNSDFYDTWLKDDENINFIYSNPTEKGDAHTLEQKLAKKRNIQSMADLQKYPLVSTVLPVYNVEQYLSECVDSVTSQTYKNLEIILVDDGSTDGSSEMCDELAKGDERIRVVHKQNEGLNMARATGVETATGSYITFIDSDDMVHADYVAEMYKSLTANNVDMAVCGYCDFTTSPGADEGETSKAEQSSPERVLRDRREILRYFLGQSQSIPGVYSMTAWGKLIAIDIVKQTDWQLSNYRRHEDNLETLQWYSASKKGVSIIPSLKLYYYRKNPHSITQRLVSNTNPAGEKLNYFEYISELYQKTKEYINDEILDIAVLRSYADSNRFQLYNYFTEKRLDNESAKAAMENSGAILDMYENKLQEKDAIIRKHESIIEEMQNSKSWKITEILRKSRSRFKR